MAKRRCIVFYSYAIPRGDGGSGGGVAAGHCCVSSRDETEVGAAPQQGRGEKATFLPGLWFGSVLLPLPVRPVPVHVCVIAEHGVVQGACLGMYIWPIISGKGDGPSSFPLIITIVHRSFHGSCLASFTAGTGGRLLLDHCVPRTGEFV
jgi:hypothetical protein